MQIDELDDQQRKHLHRDGAPQRDENDNSIFAIGANGQRPRRLLGEPKHWKTLLGMLQNVDDAIYNVWITFENVFTDGARKIIRIQTTHVKKAKSKSTEFERHKLSFGKMTSWNCVMQHSISMTVNNNRPSSDTNPKRLLNRCLSKSGHYYHYYENLCRSSSILLTDDNSSANNVELQTKSSSSPDN
uniref:Uncharacterized protein n=1 Tax=Romanomermis culicivorax TaxID=13658 RepID=A0A915J6B9_ROMCU